MSWMLRGPPFVFLFFALALAACGSSARASATAAEGVPLEAVKAIALAPPSSPLADAIGVELLNFGLQVFDTGHVSNLMVRNNLSEVEVFQPQNLRHLRDDGVDAVLHVKTVLGPHGIQSASAKITSTENGMLLAGVAWQNGSGAGRLDLAMAAKEIAKGLGGALRPKAKDARR